MNLFAQLIGPSLLIHVIVILVIRALPLLRRIIAFGIVTSVFIAVIAGSAMIVTRSVLERHSTILLAEALFREREVSYSTLGEREELALLLPYEEPTPVMIAVNGGDCQVAIAPSSITLSSYLLQTQGVNSFTLRSELAKRFNLASYTGSPAENEELLRRLLEADGPTRCIRIASL